MAMDLGPVSHDSLPIAEAEDGSFQATFAATLLGAQCAGDGAPHSCGAACLAPPRLAWTPQTDAALMATAVLHTKRRMMAPMLRDETRNRAFDEAVRGAVRRWRAAHPDREDGPVVLDIGCGTGLLSMMAARAGAREVGAFEMNRPLAGVAEEVVRANGLADKVRVVATRSSEAVPAESKADIIVTETLDSNLLDEGIVGSVSAALGTLAVPEAEVVPHSGRVFAQLFACAPGVLEGIGVSEFALEDGLPLGLERGSSLRLPVDDQYLANFHLGRLAGLTPVGAAAEVCAVDFGAAARAAAGGAADSGLRRVTCRAAAAVAARVRFVALWWECSVSPPSEPPGKRSREGAELSTDPQIDEADARWQDHWFPVVVPLLQSFEVPAGGVEVELAFDTSANRVRLQGAEAWALLADGSRGESVIDMPRTHGVPNTSFSRVRVAQLADRSRSAALRSAMEAALAPLEAPQVLDLSDGALCASLGASLGAAPVRSLVADGDEDDAAARFWAQLAPDAVERVAVSAATATDFGDRPLVLASELYYATLEGNAVLSAVHFWHQTRWARRCLRHTGPVSAVPARASVRLAAVRLGKLAAAMHLDQSVAGFDHGAVASAWNEAPELFAVPLWCYDHAFASAPCTLLDLDFAGDRAQPASPSGPLELTLSAAPSGGPAALAVAVWVDAPGSDPCPWYARHLVGLVGPSERRLAVANLLQLTLSSPQATTLRVSASWPGLALQ